MEVRCRLNFDVLNSSWLFNSITFALNSDFFRSCIVQFFGSFHCMSQRSFQIWAIASLVGGGSFILFNLPVLHTGFSLTLGYPRNPNESGVSRGLAESCFGTMGHLAPIDFRPLSPSRHPLLPRVAQSILKVLKNGLFHQYLKL